MSIPLGYTKVKKPNTGEEAYAQYRSADRGVSIAKSAVQAYINSFLDPKGRRRSYISSVSSPSGINYVTHLSYDEEQKEDPNQKKTHLARFFAENTGQLPSILLIDSGVEPTNLGISDLTKTWVKAGKVYNSFNYHVKISLSITVATLSEEDTSTLASLLMIIFGPLAKATCNYLLTSDDHQQNLWEVRLPFSNIHLGQATSSSLDDKSTVWLRSVDLVCEFETTMVIKHEPDEYKLTYAFYNNPDPTKNPLPKFLNLSPNEVIPLGSNRQLFIEFMQKHYTLAIQNPPIANITAEPPYILQPINKGKTLLYVFDKSKRVDPNSDTDESLILDIPFQVG